MYKYVVFDLDGTLIDTSEGTVKMFKKSLNHAGIFDTDENIKSLIGPPLTRRLVNDFGLSEERAREAVDVGNKYFFEKGVYECQVFDNMIETLEELKDRGIKMSVATSQPEETALMEMEHVGIHNYFETIQANNLYQTRGTKSDFIKTCLKSMDVKDKLDAIMIGDKRPDILGGKDNDLDTIGVLYGYGDLKEIKESEPTHIADLPVDIPKIILG